jgi:hypothetical protein
MIREGKNAKQISRELNIAYGTVRRVLMACGLTIDPRAKVDYRNHPLCHAADVMRLMAQGKSFPEIARELGVLTPLVFEVFKAASTPKSSAES